MTAANNYQALLREVSPATPGQTYPLSISQSIAIGRDRTCQIVLDPSQYKGVSRRHLEIRPLMSRSSTGMPMWQVCDLQSTSGTFVNGTPLQGCQTLRIGDRIKLGNNGPEFIFECQFNTGSSPHPLPVPVGNSSLHRSQMFPILSGDKLGLLQKGFLIPGILTVLVVIAMFASQDNPIVFISLLGVYLAGAGYYFVYQRCGKQKPWWLILGSALSIPILLLTPVWSIFYLFFDYVLPGAWFSAPNGNFLTIIIGAFCGPGLREELFKALPVLFLYLLGMRLSSPQRERIGVCEPLDGIIIGAAAATGFTIFETLLQYVPNAIEQAAKASGNEALGYYAGLSLLIPRILGEVAGHMAYSGYFGYFIGLSALKPSKRWQILGIGYVSAAALHGLWNAVASLAGGNIGNFFLAVSGSLAYIFLMAAILKARQLSPTRSQNFATQYRNP